METVLGPIDAGELGCSLSHEPGGANAAGLRHTYPEIIDREGIIGCSLRVRKPLALCGVDLPPVERPRPPQADWRGKKKGRASRSPR